MVCRFMLGLSSELAAAYVHTRDLLRESMVV